MFVNKQTYTVCRELPPSLPNCALCRWINFNFIYILNQFAFHLAALRLTAAPHAQLICSTPHGMSQYIIYFSRMSHASNVFPLIYEIYFRTSPLPLPLSADNRLQIAFMVVHNSSERICITFGSDRIVSVYFPS